MIHTLGPRDADALIAAGGTDVVDVRDPADWAAGHVPGARNVPLADLRADPRAKLPNDKVLFVCARGVRSLSAAKVAEEIGRSEIYSLDGGTQAWASAGLPIERPPRAEAPARTAPAPAAPAAPAQAVPAQAAPPAQGAQAQAAPPAQAVPAQAAPEASADAPEPALDEVVGQNMRALRTQRDLSLDALARMTGLSRTLLGQIELGKASPSVGVVWKIAKAFDVHFSVLLQTLGRPETQVLRGNQARRLVSPDGRFSSRALFPLGETPNVEFYELNLTAHSREDAQPHQPGTRENLIVTSGRLELLVGSERFELAPGDAIVFTADVPHSYINPSNEACRMYLVMTYASGNV